MALWYSRSVKKDYEGIITIEPGKRGGKPTIRGMRITVGDILGMLAAGMSQKEIISDFSELTKDDIRAALAYTADRERATITVVHEATFRSKSVA